MPGCIKIDIYDVSAQITSDAEHPTSKTMQKHSNYILCGYLITNIRGWGGGSRTGAVLFAPMSVKNMIMLISSK